MRTVARLEAETRSTVSSTQTSTVSVSPGLAADRTCLCEVVKGASSCEPVSFCAKGKLAGLPGRHEPQRTWQTALDSSPLLRVPWPAAVLQCGNCPTVQGGLFLFTSIIQSLTQNLEFD